MSIKFVQHKTAWRMFKKSIGRFFFLNIYRVLNWSLFLGTHNQRKVMIMTHESFTNVYSQYCGYPLSLIYKGLEMFPHSNPFFRSRAAILQIQGEWLWYQPRPNALNLIFFLFDAIAMKFQDFSNELLNCTNLPI